MIQIAPATLADAPRVFALYRDVAAASNSGLAREPDEIGLPYVEDFMRQALTNGVMLLALDSSGALLGFIDATRIGPRQFDRVLSGLTVAVHPSAQGRGIGKRLFEALFEAAKPLAPKITRFELMVRGDNEDAIRLYERLGFKV